MIETPNLHPDPANRFTALINDDLFPKHADVGGLIGFVHRHPPGFPEPSQEDFEGIGLYLGAVWCENEVRWYDYFGEFGSRSLS